MERKWIDNCLARDRIKDGTDVEEGAPQSATCLVERKSDMVKKTGNGIQSRLLTLISKLERIRGSFKCWVEKV